jgi:hypothetical protein
MQVFEHPTVEPPTNNTYLEFTRIREQMGLGPSSENDTQYKLIRATCEYLTVKAGKLPELTNVEKFLGLGWQFVLHELGKFPPVAPLVAYAQHLVTFRPDSPYPTGHIEIAVQDAQDYVQGCLNFLKQQQEQQAEVAALELQVKEQQAQYDHAQRMVKRYELLGKILLFGAGVFVGWLLGHAGK